MDINNLITIIKEKLEEDITIESIKIEDKSYLHEKHPGNQKGKFHLKIIIQSNELSKFNKIEGNKKIYKILENEMKKHIHSIQISIL